MIRYLGDFKYDFSYPTTVEDLPGDPAATALSLAVNIQHYDPTTTFNILLEYGDLDLEEYFRNRLQPYLPNEIMSFWDHLFEIPEEVTNLHCLKRRDNGKDCEYDG